MSSHFKFKTNAADAKLLFFEKFLRASPFLEGLDLAELSEWYLTHMHYGRKYREVPNAVRVYTVVILVNFTLPDALYYLFISFVASAFLKIYFQMKH